MKKGSKDTRDCRYVGNQYGHWVILSGELARRVLACCHLLRITPEQFLEQAVDAYYEKVMLIKQLEDEHQARMARKGAA